MAETAVLQIDQPGMMTTVQDLGRAGHARFGVAPGGALDRAALILGNRLLANDPEAAALEITLIGPAIAFTHDGAIALTGGDLGATLNGSPVERWRPVRVGAGDRLAFDPGRAGLGARAYLCVAGGIDVEPVMGSRSTDLIGGFGGWHGRPLKAGDLLPIGEPALPLDEIVSRGLSIDPPELSTSVTARVVLGPQSERFTESGIRTFLDSEFTVTSKSNRQGIRLDGPTIEHLHGADMTSEGIALGAIQVPGDGQPIVLLAGRQTVGGYVKIATVIGADLDCFAQLRPGDKVRFVEVSVETARAATHAYRSRLGPDSVIAGGAAHDPLTGSEVAQLAGTWDPDGVIRVIEAIERTGVTAFAIEVPGIKLDLRRGPSGWVGVLPGQPGLDVDDPDPAVSR